ncbi:MAG: hypothetical protein WC309_04650 [Candidatus Paceibacterota bacterium]|jgi:hypothetical protein
MKNALSILILVFLFSGIFADTTCNTSYTEELNIRALDANSRPMPDVTITLRYQLSESTGKGYVTTIPKPTGSDGIAKIKIQNLENQIDKLKCDITITAEYDGKEIKKTVYAGSHESLIDLNIPAYNLILTIKDQNNQKVNGATVSVGNFTKYTNNAGMVGFSVVSGEKLVLASYEGAKREAIIPVTKDTTYDISFYVSNLTINVIDDQGRPLSAAAEFFGKTYNSTLGKIIISDVGVISPDINVICNGITKTPKINLDISNEYTVIFDTTSPELISIKDQRTDKSTSLILTIIDPGSNPSGINENTLAVNYDYGNGWKYAKIFPKGSGVYIAEMDPINFDTIVFFSIYVEDKEGNTITIPGQYEIFTTILPNENGNPTDPEKPDWLSELFFTLILPLLLIAAILFGAFYAYLKFIKKEE